MPSQSPDAKDAPSSWAVVNTHANQEHIALEHLARQKFVAYCPVILRRRAHARRVESVPRPLFPGYLFARVDLASGGWRPILSTVGVRNLVRFGQSLGVIDDGFICELRAREKDGVIVRPEAPYQVGQKVRLTGPFDGVIATILELGEKERLTVLLNLLQGSVRAKVQANDVTAV